MSDPILIARHGDIACSILPGLANRHGLITGATGTGKTVTLQKLAESFSQIGVPVFLSDVKGDLTGISQPGNIGGKMADILKERGIDLPTPMACPATLWDVFGEQGHPVRATISDMGPLLLARMLDLNDTQTGVLNIVFRIADDNGMLLLDMKDLRALLQYVGDNGKQFTTTYGNISAASVGAIQRGLLQIESQGGDRFFGDALHVLPGRCTNDQVADLRCCIDAAHAFGGNEQRLVGLYWHQHRPWLAAQDAHDQEQVVVDAHAIAHLQGVARRTQ